MHGGDADDTIGVHNGVDGEEVEVEGEKVVVLLGPACQGGVRGTGRGDGRCQRV